MASELIGKNVKSFIIKSIQCIVEARLGGLSVCTVGKPNGNEWFNIKLNEFPDVNLMTKKCLEMLLNQSKDNNLPINLFLIKNDWNICCEISIKTNDNEQMNLEYWFIRSRCLGKELNLNNKNLDRDTTSRIFKSYNEMSILIKSIISLTRATPAYKISKEGQSADSYIVCYRVYKCESTFEQEFKKSKLSEFEFRNYSNEFKLGSVKTDHNIIDVSLVYRTNLRKNYDNKDNKPNLDLSVHNNLITFNNLQAIKNNNDLNKERLLNDLLPVKNDHFTVDDDLNNEKRMKERNFIPAFAFNQPKEDELPKFPDLPDEAFRHLLPLDYDDNSLLIQSNSNKKLFKKELKETLHSEPIKIPNSQLRKKTDLEQDILNCGKNNNNSSPGCSSLGSFVIVDMKTPFAQNDQNDLGSFFNGPSPTFQDNSNNLADELEDITNQLAKMEASCQVWDKFIESITSKEEDEEV